MAGIIVAVFMSISVFVMASYLSVWYWYKVVRRNN